MPGFFCPIHGNRLALVFCDHAGLAVDERRDVPVFLQQDRWGWRTLCKQCVRLLERPETMDNANYLVCVECAKAWAEITGNGYVQRSQHAQPEFPPDIAKG